MSLDLYERETSERLSGMAPVQVPETGAFDGFIRGAGLATMKGLAKTGRAIDLLGSVGPIVKDAFTGGTVLQDKYFQEHDDVFGSAVDYWTPKPNEVGVAGQITGEVLSTLLQVIASPSLAVGSAQLGTAEDLVRKGVDAGPAQAVGAVQAAGLGLGVWMPILGQNLWQRVVVGGAGFNVAQGVTTRAASEMILKGTSGEDDFKAFDGAALTLDVLMGAAFGGMVHLSPAARAQGEAAWGRIQTWAERLTPTEKAAIANLRLAQHLNVDSTPGTPAGPADVEAHVNRVRTAVEQMERGQKVEVSDLPEPRTEVDEKRAAEAERHGEALVKQAERVRKAEDIPEAPHEPKPVERPAIAPEESQQADAAVRLEAVKREISDVEGAIAELKKAPGYVEGRSEHGTPMGNNVVRLDQLYQELKTLEDQPKTEAPAAKPGGETEPPPPRGDAAGAEAAGAEANPIRMEAERLATEAPTKTIRVGTDAEGKPIVKTWQEFLEDSGATTKQAAEDAKLFEVAAACMLGKGA